MAAHFGKFVGRCAAAVQSDQIGAAESARAQVENELTALNRDLDDRVASVPPSCAKVRSGQA